MPTELSLRMGLPEQSAIHSDTRARSHRGVIVARSGQKLCGGAVIAGFVLLAAPLSMSAGHAVKDPIRAWDVDNDGFREY